MHAFCHLSHSKSHRIEMDYKTTKASNKLAVEPLTYSTIQLHNQKTKLSILHFSYQCCTSCRLKTAQQSQSWKTLYHQSLLILSTTQGSLLAASKGIGYFQDRPYQRHSTRRDCRLQNINNFVHSSWQLYYWLFFQLPHILKVLNL